MGPGGHDGRGRAVGITLLAVFVGLAVLGAACMAALRELGGNLGGPADTCMESHQRVLTAAAAGDRAEVADQLRKGASPNVEEAGETPLTCAARMRRVGVVGLLLDQGAKPTAKALREAVGASGGAFGAVSTSRDLPDDAHREQVTVLLLDHGADPDGGAEGPSPLLYAAWSGQATLVDLLLDHGADPDHGGRVDSVIVTLARLDPFSSTTLPPRLLPDPQGGEVANMPPLVGAAWEGHVDIATRLLDGGADPDLLSDQAFSPILAAATKGDRPMVELLLAHDADPRPQVRPGVPTPAEAARGTGHPDIAALLDPHP
jgi:ankyrin repeat protein